MTAQEVLEVLATLERASIPTWVIGGWGIDALVGRITREHGDLDLFIHAADEDRSFRMLRADGFSLERDGRPSHFKLRDLGRRKVDLHLFESLGDDGVMWRRQDGSERMRLPADWDSSGSIDGVIVACASAATQRRLHSGYVLDAVGNADLLLLDNV